MTESIADGLSVVGLVVGFPLLLLAFMISLERLESWGLRDADQPQPEQPEIRDAVEAAVADVERQPQAAAQSDEASPLTERAAR